MNDSGELRATLSQLCADLLAPSVSRDDQRDILRSLTGLVEQFPLAKKSLGRLLSDQQPLLDNAHTDAAPAAAKAIRPLLAELASRYLYDRVTSQSTIALLAALAHDNSINQRRIVRWVPGVRLAADSFADSCDSKTAKKGGLNDLYVLSVPEPIKATYRRWRKRQRALHAKSASGGHGRVPMGTPPSKDGVPMPCYCDDCLGAEQLLSTWCRHFKDLSRWTSDPNETMVDGAGDTGPGQVRPVLAASDFFRMELMDYQLLNCVPGMVLDGLMVESLEQPRDNRRCSRIYFFAPREQAASAVEFDPVHHLSAIHIPSDVFDMVDQTRQLPSPSLQQADHVDGNPSRRRSGSGAATDKEEEGDPLSGLDEVVLFEGRLAAKVYNCRNPTSQDTSSIAKLPAPDEEILTGGEGTITAVLKAARAQSCDQEKISRADLLQKINGDDSLEESTVLVLRLVLAFFADEEMISMNTLEEVFGHHGSLAAKEIPTDTVGGEVTEVGDAIDTDERPEAGPIDALATVRARLSDQKLRIEFVVNANESTLDEASTRAIYAIDLLQSDVCNALAVPESHLALIGLSDDDLQLILSHCCVCRCEGHHEDDNGSILSGSPICLRFSRIIDSECAPMTYRATEAEMISKHDDPHLNRTSNEKSSGLLPGLPDAVKTVLARILDAVEGGSSRLGGSDALPSLVKQLSSAIASCNARISQLSTSRKGVGDHARLAASSRCRACRDELIQLCKQIKIASDEQSESALSAAGGVHGLLSSRKRQSRVQRAIRTGLQSVLATSERFDAWETPDERVGKLRLDRNVWASGVPDFEFFQESDARVAENKRRQRELSRRLQQHYRRGSGM